MDVSRRRPRAYVIGPFRANSEFLRRQNIARAERAALDLATLGFYYRCPHLHSAHFDVDTTGISERVGVDHPTREDYRFGWRP